jgi:hypothetical protein
MKRNLMYPRSQQGRYVQSCRFSYTLPEILSGGVTVKVLVKIQRDAFEEFFFTRIFGEHTQNCNCLTQSLPKR